MKVIHPYNRRQAIADGVLVDVTEVAKRVGIRIQTAVTAAVWAMVVKVPDGVTCQDEAARLWDILQTLRYEVLTRKSRESWVKFQLFVKNDEAKPAEVVTPKAQVGRGDDLRPVITIMLPNDD